MTDIWKLAAKKYRERLKRLEKEWRLQGEIAEGKIYGR
jgi:hypothetical protein